MKQDLNKFQEIIGYRFKNEALLELRHTEGRNTEEFEDFRNLLLSGYAHTDPYYATLARIIYDVPAVSADGRRLEDGDQVYEALLFSVCPVIMLLPVCGILHHGLFHNLDEMRLLTFRNKHLLHHGKCEQSLS